MKRICLVVVSFFFCLCILWGQPFLSAAQNPGDMRVPRAHNPHLDRAVGLRRVTWNPKGAGSLLASATHSSTNPTSEARTRGFMSAAVTYPADAHIRGSVGVTASQFAILGKSPFTGTAGPLYSSATGASATYPCSIWPGEVGPSVPDAGPDSPVELGLRFHSDVDGYITGIRFYKSADNVGAHIGNLWTAAGTRLATTTFIGETTSGWQQVNFPTAVAITANTDYIASYHTNAGHYAYDANYFASHGVDNSPLHASQNTAGTPNGVYAYGSSAFPGNSWASANYWVDVVFVPAGGDTNPPTIQYVSPATGAFNIDPESAITATFNEELNAATVSGSSMQLLDSSSNLVPSAVTYIAALNTATLTPDSPLLTSTGYSVVLKGGIIKDLAGNALTSDFTWSFTTEAAPAPPPNDGPGGPILIVSSSSDPFSRYYDEILRTEGLNEFTATDVSLVSAATLANYDVVILGSFPVTSAQASMFASWVNAGGNLVAMRPDKQLAGLLGLVDTGTILSDGYILMDTGSGPGVGLVGQTIQFHGNADIYTANGATTLATLYLSATAATMFPAVTLKHVGLGQAAAFTYDLARSVIFTRQGNPAWAGEPRDAQAGPIRPDNLFYGNAPFGPEPDYVDRTKIAIPQADEQQRLLANLIIQMNVAKHPLPRFWYFPSNFTAAVVMTGDDHGAMYNGGATQSRFDYFLSVSPAGCSVANWQCVRASSYLIAPSIASNPLSNAQAASYIAQGFEISAHMDSVPDCSDWTPSELASFYSAQISSFLSKYTSAPPPKTHRMHCVSWTDYDSQPQIELQNGIRLDTTYYYWPPAWVNDTPGLFTGSGMPMRYAARNGETLDIYQATSQMTDESGQSYPATIDTLLDNATGPNAYYGYFTANMHNDVDSSPGAEAIVASAQARSVPIISAAQLLTWLDGRNGSSFTSLVWNGSTLTFGIAVASGANGLQAMVPANVGTATLNSITLNGSTVSFALETIKGIQYGVFPASAGTYQANYGVNSGITISSVTMNPSTVVGGNVSTGTIILSAPAPSDGGLQVSLTTSDSSTTSLSSQTVTIPQGATSSTFSVNTNVVAVATSVVISAIYGGNAVSSNLMIEPPPIITALALNPATVAGGTSSMATVTLSEAAPANGVVVNLSSANASVASVPTTVTIAGGSTTATFMVTTTSVSQVTTLLITASYGSSVTATLTVNPPTSSVASISLNPASVFGGSTNSTGTVTLSGAAPSNGASVALSSNNTSAATVPSSVNISGGETTATFAVTSHSVSASTFVRISASYNGTTSASLTVNPVTVSSVTLNPASVTGGASSTGTVTLNSPAPSGGAVVTLQDNSTATTVPSSVTVSAGATTKTFTVTTTSVTTTTVSTITAAYNGASKTATLTVTTPYVQSVTLSPASVIGGSANSTGTVTLNGRAPTGGAKITLSSSNGSAATVPSSVTVAANATTATFTVTSHAVTSAASVSISANYNGAASAALTVNPAGLSTFTLNPTSVYGGFSSTGTVALNGAAPSGGAVVTVKASSTTASVPSSVTVAAGRTSVTFTVTTKRVTAASSVSITVTYGGTSISKTLTVRVP